MLPCAFVHGTTTPQFAVVSSATSQPLAALPSQLPKPAEHDTEHAPRLHEAVPFVPLQAVPHAPQFPALVCVFVSQPLLGLPSQLAKFGEQLGTHAPEVHAVLPFAFVQALAHVPQWAVVLRGVSQPLATLPSQSPKPELQDDIAQVPVAQLEVALARLHETPHAPQLAVVLSDASQPLLGLPSQLANAAAPGVHAPAVQVVVPLELVHACRRRCRSW